jgi:hypothetical protein
MCIRSFLSNGHAFDLYSYTLNLNVPAGCNLLDARKLFPKDQVFFYEKGPGKGSVSLFSNAFRYKLLAEKGGWWVDTDVVCLTDALPAAPYVFGYQDKYQLICTAIVKTPPGDRLMRKCLKIALKTGTDADWAETGPALITRMVKKFGLGRYSRPIPAFYPYGWEEAMQALDPAHTDRLLTICRESMCVHLWNEMFRRSKINKFHPPPAGSLIDYFFKIYNQ